MQKVIQHNSKTRDGFDINAWHFASCRIFTLYSKSLPLDVASRVWDLFCRDGEEFLFKTAIGKRTLIFSPQNVWLLLSRFEVRVS